ncbi:hypothetical protein AALO_G00172400 [Alosa alosa]|uniref:H15 domain-containing protein n=1 Tax=Alosa alosa TaxID=278164 RepID=A0AAV6GAA8_9TELE|nr:hypothetical protein AALO_G00172400 [Alosa alosa]
MAKPSRGTGERGVKVLKNKIDMGPRETKANSTGSKSDMKPRSGRQMGHRGLGKAGAKRLGQMLKKAIQQKEGVQGNKDLPKTPVGLLKHQADAIAKATSSERPKLVPRVSDLILQVIAQCKSQGCISMVELKKALAAGGYDVSKNNSQVNKVVRGLVRTETLLQTSGKGTESYRFNTKKLTSEKRIRTRAARRKEAGKVVKESPVAQLSAATERSTEAPSKAASRDKPTSKAMPGEKSAETVRNAKPKARASPAKRVKNSPKKKGGEGKTKATRKNRR